MMRDLLNPISAPPKVIDGIRIEQDPATAAQLAQKVEEAKRFLGDRYLLHPSHRIERKVA